MNHHNEPMSHEMSPQPVANPDSALGRRVVAGLIDFLVLLAVMIVIGLLVGETVRGPETFSVYLGGLGTLIFAVAALLYYFVTESQLDRSPGKAALGLSVTGADGSKPTPEAIAIRTVLRFIDWLPFFYVVGFISVLATSGRRQRWGIWLPGPG